MLHLDSTRLSAHDAHTRFVIAPHHPDRLRRPAGAAGAGGDDAFRHALTWNVLRTLALTAPAFWLRRLHVRLTDEPSLVAPQIADVQLWRALPLPPIQRIDGGRADVVVDVVIETEHDVWALFVEPDALSSNLSERAADVVDAGGWLAGRRFLHSGVIESDASDGRVARLLRSRYARSLQSAALRSAARGPAAPAHSPWGGVRWTDLAAVLRECAEARMLSAIERALAANALDWLRSVEVEPNH